MKKLIAIFVATVFVAATTALALGPKIVICHLPPGNPDNPQTIEIDDNAWPAHEAHGDTLGECASLPD